MAQKIYKGSCHCGAVRFEAEIDLAKGTNKCNCSTCTKARSWFAILKPESIRASVGEENLTTYDWIPPGKTSSFLHFRFCKTCGVRTFGLGGDKEHGEFRFVNVAALDDVDADELAAAPTNYADGRHDRFDKPAPDTRLL
jgi:hypothetical protein